VLNTCTQHYSPARPFAEFRKTHGLLTKLPYIIKDVKEMKKRFEEKDGDTLKGE